MPGVAGLFTDIGIAQSTVPTAATAQTKAALLWNIDIISSFWDILPRQVN
jgi:hypothetical protein